MNRNDARSSAAGIAARFSAMLLGLAALALSGCATPAPAPTPAGTLYRFAPGIEARWASPENPTAGKGVGGQENRGAKGHAFDTIPAGASLVLADVEGAGTIRRIWITINNRSPEMLRALRIEMFWDGAAAPAVSAPLGDFFGHGLGRMVPMETALFASPEGRSFVSYVPMPFRRSARIVVTNTSAKDLPLIFYDVDFTRVAAQPDDALYFHADWHHDDATRLGEAFRILPRVTGRGRYLGATISVVTDPAYGKTWWGEGEVRIFLDGDRAHPTLIGTGTEDYIGTAWGQGAFIGRYQGAPVADPEHRQWSFYRYHIPDPIWFDREIEVTLQQIGGAPKADVQKMLREGVRLKPITVDPGNRPGFRKLLEGDAPIALDSPDLPDGWTNFYRSDDVAAVAYYYLSRP